MPNDTKLGLLTGVAGVVAAAVLYSQNPQSASPAPSAAAAAPAQPATSAVTRDPKPTVVAGSSVVSTGRPEVEARAVSRPTAPDE